MYSVVHPTDCETTGSEPSISCILTVHSLRLQCDTPCHVKNLDYKTKWKPTSKRYCGYKDLQKGKCPSKIDCCSVSSTIDTFAYKNALLLQFSLHLLVRYLYWKQNLLFTLFTYIIQCCGSLTFWCRSGSGCVSCSFRQWCSRWQQKIISLLITFFKDKKS